MRSVGALARAVLGLPELKTPPSPAAEKVLADKPVTAAQRAQLAGSFTKFDKLPA